jgi:hypothetical protein
MLRTTWGAFLSYKESTPAWHLLLRGDFPKFTWITPGDVTKRNFVPGVKRCNEFHFNMCSARDCNIIVHLRLVAQLFFFILDSDDQVVSLLTPQLHDPYDIHLPSNTPQI